MEDGGAKGVPVPFNRAAMACPSLTDRSRKSEAPSQQPSPPHRSSVSKPPDKTTIGGEVNGIAKFRVHVTWFSSREVMESNADSLGGYLDFSLWSLDFRTC